MKFILRRGLSEYIEIRANDDLKKARNNANRENFSEYLEIAIDFKQEILNCLGNLDQNLLMPTEDIYSYAGCIIYEIEHLEDKYFDKVIMVAQVNLITSDINKQNELKLNEIKYFIAILEALIETNRDNKYFNIPKAYIKHIFKSLLMSYCLQNKII